MECSCRRKTCKSVAHPSDVSPSRCPCSVFFSRRCEQESSAAAVLMCAIVHDAEPKKARSHHKKSNPDAYTLTFMIRAKIRGFCKVQYTPKALLPLICPKACWICSVKMCQIPNTAHEFDTCWIMLMQRLRSGPQAVQWIFCTSARAQQDGLYAARQY